MAVTGLVLVGFVVGLPIHADGTDSRMSIEVERFGHGSSLDQVPFGNVGFELDISALKVFAEPTTVGDGLSEAETIEDRIDASHRLGLEQLAVRFADLLGGSVQEGDALAIDPAKFPMLDLARFPVRFGQSARGG